MSPVKVLLKTLVAALLLAVLPSANADNAPLTSHHLLAQLQAFMRERNADTADMTPDEMVQAMTDWYRFARPGGAGASADVLVFRYGGWSEGCATAFNLSLLRKMKMPGEEGEAVAGITMMFEPSSQVELKPWSSSTSDSKSIEEFVQAVEASPAFKLLGGSKPMSVLMESGALR
ncbi:MAG TPA: hypothetical protein VHB46_13365 [Burkholderiales bacterium]|nr:hypothetical protein [Burkholderiales bacterium]